MSWYAVEDIDDAFRATRQLLTPVQRGRWFRLAVIVFFVGGPGTSLNVLQANTGGTSDLPTSGTSIPGLSQVDLWGLLLPIVLGVVLIGVVMLLIGSVMEFVLLEALRRETVSIRDQWRRHWRKGLRVFGFRLVLGAVILGIILGLLAVLVIPHILGIGTPISEVSLIAVVLLIPFVISIGIVGGIIYGFTTLLVVPVMLQENCGVLAGWRRVAHLLRRNVWQFLLYGILAFVLSAVLAMLVGLGTLVGAIVLLVPFGLVGAVGFFIWTMSGAVGAVLLILTALLYVAALLSVLAVVQMPAVVFLRYYALMVLGDVDGGPNLIPNQREDVRTDPT